MTLQSIFAIFVFQAAILVFTVSFGVIFRASFSTETLYIDIFRRFQALVSAKVA